MFSQKAFDLTVYSEVGRGNPLYKAESGPLGMYVGYGHVLKSGESIQLPLTFDRAQELLNQDLMECGRWLLDFLGDQYLVQHQFDAVICWLYQARQRRCEARSETWPEAKLLTYLKAGEFQFAGAEFSNWVFLNGVFQRSLAVRRDREHRLFTTGFVEF